MNYSYIPSIPTSYVGWGASEKLIDEINRLKPDRILLVADPFLVKLGILDELLASIRKNGYTFDLYTDIIPEPTLKTGNKLVDFMRKRDFSLVIGVGGGSALDLSKLAAVFADNEGNLKDYLNLTATRKIANKGVFKILIPTTSGTGSEITDIAVLALENTKDVVSHEYLKADVAIVDPKLTLSVPSAVTAATGADALTHAIEAYLSVNANPVSDGHALQAIRLIGKALRQAVTNGDDEEARTAMAFGSYMAGLAFYNAGVGAVHALAYPLGGQFHISHGASNAVMLPYVLSYICKSCASRLKDILQALGENTYGMGDGRAAEICMEKLVLFVKEIGIPGTLKDFNIPESAIAALAADGAKQARLLARCPVSLTENDIANIYQAAFRGEMVVRKA